ncbi:Beta-1,4-xylosyltransferase IRX9 [Linum perenne]
MGSLERPRKKVQIWKKAVVHFALCFVMGFFSGFVPTSKSSSMFSRSVISSNTSSASITHSPPQIASLTSRKININRTTTSEPPVSSPDAGNQSPPSSSNPDDRETEEDFTGTAEFIPELKLTSRRLIIIITPTNARDPFRNANPHIGGRRRR